MNQVGERHHSESQTEWETELESDWGESCEWRREWGGVGSEGRGVVVVVVETVPAVMPVLETVMSAVEMVVESVPSI